MQTHVPIGRSANPASFSEKIAFEIKENKQKEAEFWLSKNSYKHQDLTLVLCSIIYGSLGTCFLVVLMCLKALSIFSKLFVYYVLPTQDL